MNLYYLQYFPGGRAARELLPKAARDMHVTQPTVSNGVRELEETLGVKLFNRGSRHVSLTMEGRERSSTTPFASRTSPRRRKTAWPAGTSCRAKDSPSAPPTPR